ncbi:MAG: hypothetical protein DI534_12300 [Leifsonia xyli]|nr:MAG: hypothetical protein DI534_12300 [Leifsonia xyli]
MSDVDTAAELDPQGELDDEFPDDVTDDARPRRHWVLGLWLVIAGVLGELAAFELTLEKLRKLADPDAVANCDINPFVQCGKNLESWQGSLFGFPNPIIGLICWMAPIVVGVALIAGVRFPRWFMAVFNLGLLGAVIFVVWLMTQSFFELRTLCLWCGLTWAVTYPSFLAVTFHNLARGVFGERGRPVGRALTPWVAPISLLIYVVILAIAQINFDLIGSLVAML